MTFAEKFLKFRKQALLSQEEAAEKIGVSRQAISRWEQGTALPDAFNLSIICKVFGVSADYLINDDVTENAAENVSAAFNSDDDGASFVMVEKLDSVQVQESSAGNISINDLPYDTVINFSFELVFLIWFAVYLIAGLLTTFFLRQPVAKND